MLFKPDAAQAVGFTPTCGRSVLIYTRLVVMCSRRNGQWVRTIMSLNSRIANDGGRLVWRNRGGFGVSCRRRRLLYDSVRQITILHAMCPNNAGTLVGALINLDEKINNIDGTLRSHGIPGRRDGQ